MPRQTNRRSRLPRTQRIAESNDFPPDSELDNKQESNSCEPLDRLSELPDSVINFIFSFLPMEYVVRTTILSKRWKDLWTFVPYLHFQAKEGKLDKFTSFVNRTLMLWRGKKIQKFTVGFDDVYEPSLCNDLNLWVRFALEHEVEELNLDYFYVTLDSKYWMPRSLFSCSSIRKLLVLDCNMDVSGEIRWDQLKSLSIHNVRWGQVEIDKVLSGSPQLEILTMYDSENVSIRSGSLKKLFIHYDSHNHYGTQIDSVLKIWTPNLQVLEISGFLYKFLQLNAPSLVEANLHFCPMYNAQQLLRDIFQSIQHVEKLWLGTWCIEVLSAMERNDLPSPLLNLKCLTIGTVLGNFVHAGIVNLLEISPDVCIFATHISGPELFQTCPLQKIETSSAREVFKSEKELPDSCMMRLKTVTITWSANDPAITMFSLIELFLKNANALEKMVIRAKPIDSESPELLFGIAQKLLRMPRSSPKAEVVLCRWDSEDAW